MWRYQTSPSEFGSASWACHQRCGDYTNWRIVHDDVAKVPMQDRPQSWGDGEWIEEVRRIRRGQSKGEAPQADGGGGSKPSSGENKCIIH